MQGYTSKQIKKEYLSKRRRKKDKSSFFEKPLLALAFSSSFLFKRLSLFFLFYFLPYITQTQEFQMLHPITQMFNSLTKPLPKSAYVKSDWCVECHSRVTKKSNFPYCNNCARKLKMNIAS